MDIYSKFPGAPGALSNFTPFHFIFDGVECASMEGFLQSLLTNDPELQKQICRLVGLEAKLWGTRRLETLGETRRLWWKGEEYDRHSDKYQELLDRVFDARLKQNGAFRRVLLSTGNEVLTHSIAKDEGPEKTILTEQEFCSRLMAGRVLYKSKFS